MERDLHNNIDDVVALDPQAIGSSTTTVGNIIDTAGFESIEYIMHSKLVTDGDYALLLEEGDDPALADAAAVPAENILGALTGFTEDTDDNSSYRVGSIGKKRYQRCSVVSTNVTIGVDSLGVLAILGHSKRKPIAQ